MPIKTKVTDGGRIFQGDIFQNIDMVENYYEENEELVLKKINFPYVICLTQDCDLLSDYRDKTEKPNENRNCKLLQIIIAPLFNFEKFKSGEHWGKIFDACSPIKPNKSNGQAIMKNETPRYHYLEFAEYSHLPPMIADFKHFFTISTEYLYT